MDIALFVIVDIISVIIITILIVRVAIIWLRLRVVIVILVCNRHCLCLSSKSRFNHPYIFVFPLRFDYVNRWGRCRKRFRNRCRLRNVFSLLNDIVFNIFFSRLLKLKLVLNGMLVN